MTEDELEKMINDHWAYVEDVLEAHVVNSDIIEIAEFHYKSAFRHGFKHAEDNQ